MNEIDGLLLVYDEMDGVLLDQIESFLSGLSEVNVTGVSYFHSLVNSNLSSIDLISDVFVKNGFGESSDITSIIDVVISNVNISMNFVHLMSYSSVELISGIEVIKSMFGEYFISLVDTNMEEEDMDMISNRKK